VRDQTADVVAARRGLEERLLNVFRRWGYREVATPVLEYLDTFLHGAGPGVSDRLLKLVDAGGEVLALRPEMTVPLARFAATRLLPAGSAPVRLAYVAEVFRGQERGSGRLREFTQAGVELIGDGRLYADVEVIALAAEALSVAGVPDAVISVGHAGFLRGVLSTLPDELAEAARDVLYRRAFAELSGLTPAGPAREALRTLPTLRGDRALERAGRLAASVESLQALEALRTVLDGVAAHRHRVRVEVDLGLIRDFDYYSGVVFEAHGPRGGMPLLGGGRYDGLLARFGHPAPATGFAIGLERVLDTTGARGESRRVVAVVFAQDAYPAAVQVASRLREAGESVVIAAEDAGLEDAACVVRLDRVDADRLTVVAGGQEIVVSDAEVAAAVGAAVGPTR
jgi:ATP phosphoribosyltransferase regulatory subunit